jgi:hypothetical protein
MTDQTDSPRKYQRAPSSPHDDATLRKRNAHLERELAITRRYLHKVQREQGLELSKFYGMPRFGKLRYRPIILGYAPSAGARSGLPFDDEFGDAMCDVFGLIGFPAPPVQLQGAQRVPLPSLGHAPQGPGPGAARPRHGEPRGAPAL